MSELNREELDALLAAVAAALSRILDVPVTLHVVDLLGPELVALACVAALGGPTGLNWNPLFDPTIWCQSRGAPLFFKIQGQFRPQ